MKGKKVFLCGAYDSTAAQAMKALTVALQSRGIESEAYRLGDSSRGTLSMNRWHAKMTIFTAGIKPVIAVIGSSNMSRPSMDGLSDLQTTAVTFPVFHSVEAESVYWLKGHPEANSVVRDAFGMWSTARPTIAFDDEQFDPHVDMLIEGTSDAIVKQDWTRI